jgi:hypothetical protein
MDRARQAPEVREHKTQRMTRDAGHAGGDDRRYTQNDTATYQQIGYETVALADHHQREKQQALQRLEPCESMACDVALIFLSNQVLLDRLQIPISIGSGWRARATVHIVRSSRLRYMHSVHTDCKVTAVILGANVAMGKVTPASLNLRYLRWRSLRLSLRGVALSARLFSPTSADDDTHHKLRPPQIPTSRTIRTYRNIHERPEVVF